MLISYYLDPQKTSLFCFVINLATVTLNYGSKRWPKPTVLDSELSSTLLWMWKVKPEGMSQVSENHSNYFLLVQKETTAIKIVGHWRPNGLQHTTENFLICVPCQKERYTKDIYYWLPFDLSEFTWMNLAMTTKILAIWQERFLDDIAMECAKHCRHFSRA